MQAKLESENNLVVYKRIFLYFSIGLFLFLLCFWARFVSFPYSQSYYAYIQLLTVSVLAILALQAVFYSIHIENKIFFKVLAFILVLNFIFEFIHTVSSFPEFISLDYSVFYYVFRFSWLLSQILLPIGIIIGFSLEKWNSKNTQSYILAASSGLLIVGGYFFLIPLEYRSFFPVRAPEMIALSGLYFIALILVYSKKLWEQQLFWHFLLISLFILFEVNLLILPSAFFTSEIQFALADLFKLIAYFIILIGLTWSLYKHYFTIKITQGSYIELTKQLQESLNERHLQAKAFMNLLEDLKNEQNTLTNEVRKRKIAEKKLVRLNQELEGLIKRKTVRLEDKNKELQHLFYIISHDLKEPLRTISSFSELLSESESSSLSTKGKKYLKYLEESSLRAQDLIRDLLTYARVGMEETESEPIELKGLLKDILEDLKRVIEESNATIIIDENLPVINGKPALIKQLFQNLLSNAIKFKSQIPLKIQIISKCLGDEYQFCIEDNGIGFEEEYSDQIFQVFRTLHSRNSFKGTGIGLSICKKIVDVHKGRIWAESEVDKGSRFYFTLPLGPYKTVVS